MLLGHRYYDSSTGRFLTRDPAKNGNNWYAYASNNPLRWVDPSGLGDNARPKNTLKASSTGVTVASTYPGGLGSGWRYQMSLTRAVTGALGGNGGLLFGGSGGNLGIAFDPFKNLPVYSGKLPIGPGGSIGGGFEGDKFTFNYTNAGYEASLLYTGNTKKHGFTIGALVPFPGGFSGGLNYDPNHRVVGVLEWTGHF